MGFAWLLLALLPLALMPDYLGDDADSSEPAPDSNDPAGETGDAASAQLVPLAEALDAFGQTDASEGAPQDNLADVIAPHFEDDIPGETAQTIDPGTILAPVVEVDTDDEEDDTDDDEDGLVLSPVDEIESQEHTIWIDPNDDGGVGYAEIEDFVVGQDILQLSVSPSPDGSPPEIELHLSDDGQDSHVFVGQELVAVLKGAADASLNNIKLVPV